MHRPFSILNVLLSAVILLFSPIAVGQNKSRVYFTFTQPTDAALQKVYKLYREAPGLLSLAELINRQCILTRDVGVDLKECGRASAHYSATSGRIVLCYELIVMFERTFLAAVKAPVSGQDAKKVGYDVFSTVVFVFFHELAHALIDQWKLPVVGREEDAADQFAAVLLVNEGKTGPVMVATAARQFAALARSRLAHATKLQDIPFWDEHSFDLQRMYDLACLVYGSDPPRFTALVGNDALPLARAERCPAEWQKVSRSWTALLKPHVDNELHPKK